MYYSGLLDEAIAFAAAAHGDQLRKNPDRKIPYIQHVVMVGFILQRAGFEEEVAAAGILHDVLEDTPTSEEDLKGRFGRRIAELVISVSEKDKSLPWEARKNDYLLRLSGASKDSLAIAAADKLHNINSITSALSEGVAIWSVFKRGKEEQMRRFRKFHLFLRGCWSHPLVDELEAALRDLETMA